MGRARTMIAGINYPWTVFQGQPNYGCDFGRNIWGSHAGVTAHADEVRADFAAIAATGVNVVRWFVFTDGRGGVRWEGDGSLVGLADGFFDDMDAALGIARDARIRLCLVLLDHSWMWQSVERAACLATAPGLARFLDRIVDPMLDRYGRHGLQAEIGRGIHSIDVMNEPDWVTRELAPDRALDPLTGRGRLQRPFTLAELRTLVSAVADRVHRHTDALVTVGGGRIRFAAQWDDPRYRLDFVQVHSYPDIRHPDRDEAVLGRSAAEFGLSKPLLIGECPSNGDRCHPADHVPPPCSLWDYLDLARDGGYLGAWPWSFKGVDAFGAVDGDAMREWYREAD